MKLSAVLTVVLLPILAVANPVAVPEADALVDRSTVSCVVGSSPAPGYSCASTDTNRCPIRETLAAGSIVSVQCYYFGEAVNGNQLWYRHFGSNFEYIPALYLPNCFNMGPC